MFNNVTEASNTLIDQAGHTVDVAIHGAQRMAHHAMEGVSDTLHSGGRQVRIGAQDAADTTMAYIRKEPIKAVLIAAATGAVIVALARLVSRPHSAD